MATAGCGQGALDLRARVAWRLTRLDEKAASRRVVRWVVTSAYENKPENSVRCFHFIHARPCRRERVHVRLGSR